MNNPILAVLVNHLWQSTLFAALMWALTLLLRRNSARARYSLWLAASAKFLLPFALLAAIGTQLPSQPTPVEHRVLPSRFLTVVGDITVPMTSEVTLSPSGRVEVAAGDPAELPVNPLLLLAWTVGALFVAGRWLVRWLAVRRALHGSATVAGIEFPVPVRVASGRLEPGIVGIIRPALLLPADIEELLTRDQMRAVLAHERCHLRWRDNLAAALHMLVETVFWFHPLVWWIGARLFEERERACDEQVVRDGCAPRSYAEGILAVCEHYIASRLLCVSGISGADLRKRVERILSDTHSLKLDGRAKAVLAAIACSSVAGPIAAGALSGSLRQVLFSFTAVTSAKLEFSGFLDVFDDQSKPLPARKQSLRSYYCPSLTDRALVRQKALAAAVATLSADNGGNVLLYAVAANSVPDVKRLLATGAPRNGDRFTGDRFSVHISLARVAASFAGVEMLQTLADAGFGIDNADLVINLHGTQYSGGTPLMFAVLFGRQENVEWLLAHGADVNAITVTGKTPMSTAASCNDQDMLTRLLRAGAVARERAVEVAAKSGFTPAAPLEPGAPAAAPAPSATAWASGLPLSARQESGALRFFALSFPPGFAGAQGFYVTRLDGEAIPLKQAKWSIYLIASGDKAEPQRMQSLVQTLGIDEGKAQLLLGHINATIQGYRAALGAGYKSVCAGRDRFSSTREMELAIFQAQLAANAVRDQLMDGSSSILGAEANGLLDAYVADFRRGMKSKRIDAVKIMVESNPDPDKLKDLFCGGQVMGQE